MAGVVINVYCISQAKRVKKLPYPIDFDITIGPI